MTASGVDVDAFVRDGYVRLDDAFPRTVADAGRELLWRASGCDEGDPSSWSQPVVRLGYLDDPPLVASINTSRLHAAFDVLCGAGHWQPRRDVGTFALRFPSPEAPGDDGWHVDASMPGDDPGDWSTYRVDTHSHGRQLLVLMLYSDVGPDDAPTRIRVGSHRTVARLLAPAGGTGLGFMALAAKLDATCAAPVVDAVGTAGTAYLCHPFLAHAAQPHRGRAPRFLAQPPLHPAPDASGPATGAVRHAIEAALAG